MRTTSHSILVAAGLLGAVTSAAPLAAQGTVRGTLFDSLRANAPIAGVEVVVLGASRKATTDAQGKFEIADVPAGRHMVAVWAPWLDSLALPPLQREVEVGGSGSVAIAMATPSQTTYQTAVCGTTFPEDQGVLVGEIRDVDGVPQAGVGVSTRWTETSIGVGMFEKRMVAAVDTSNAAGLYKICGVPVGAMVSLRAIGQAGVGSNEIVEAINARVQRRDLSVGPKATLTRITGRVLGPEGQPLKAATVAVTGDSVLMVSADAEGKFVLDGVPRRSTQLVVRSLGHVPAFAAVEPVGDAVEIDDVKVIRIPQELATVTVSGEPITAAALEFANRKASGLGTFIDDEQIKRMPIIGANQIAALAPNLATAGDPRGRMLMMRRGMGFCRPRFFIDGYDNGNISAEEESSVLSRAKRVEVYSANESPPKYNDFDGCGAIVIWTR